MQNCTIEEIRALIPPEISGMASMMSDDWCHPQQLRLLRELAHKIVMPLTPKSDPEGFAANRELDHCTNNELSDWYGMIKNSVAVSRLAQSQSEKDRTALSHLIWIIADDLRRNWEFFEAPKLLIT